MLYDVFCENCFHDRSQFHAGPHGRSPEEGEEGNMNIKIVGACHSTDQNGTQKFWFMT